MPMTFKRMIYYIHLLLKFRSKSPTEPEKLGSSWARLRPNSARPWLENTAPADVCDIEPGPEPQMARNGRSSLARSRSWLETAARAWPGAAAGSRNDRLQKRRWLEMAARAWPKPRNARLVLFEPPRKCRMLDGSHSSLLWRHSMLEKCRSRPLPRGAFVARVRNDRSKNAGS